LRFGFMMPSCICPGVGVQVCVKSFDDWYNCGTVQGEFAHTSTFIAGSPTVHESRKNSSYLQSGQPPIGPTPMRLARISAPMPPVP
jgi:hypothetical protein